MMGDEGFGYDPTLIPDGEDRTFAQMDPSEKHQQAHRYRALMKVKSALQHHPIIEA